MAQQNYFQICIQQNFKSFCKIVLSVYISAIETGIEDCNLFTPLFFPRTFGNKMSGATIAGAPRFFSRGSEMAHFKRTRN